MAVYRQKVKEINYPPRWWFATTAKRKISDLVVFCACVPRVLLYRDGSNFF